MWRDSVHALKGVRMVFRTELDRKITLLTRTCTSGKTAPDDDHDVENPNKKCKIASSTFYVARKMGSRVAASPLNSGSRVLERTSLPTSGSAP